jgi:serine/threonine protein kinase
MSGEPVLPEQIGRRYVVSRRLGLGAMGKVFLARDPVLERDVAVKVLRDDLGIPEDQRRTLVDRMRQEARAAARVSHPNIVALHDMGEDPNVGLFLVFEYLDGESLKDRLARGPIGPVTAARLAREVGGALATAHQAEVLHRDIKPENLVLTRNGAKIADFGIARLPDSTLTMGGRLLGTPAYSAPEALSGGRFSPKSDQFSLAATLYEALAGRRPFPGEDAMAVASQIANEDPAPLAETIGADIRVDAVLAQGLAKDPRSRFENCEDFGKALAEALELAPRSQMPTLPDEVHRERARELTGTRSTRVAVGGAAIGALLAITAFQLTSPMREKKDEPPPASATSAPGPGWPRTRALPVAWLEERTPVAPASSAPRKSDKKKAALPDPLASDETGELASTPRWRPDGGAGRASTAHDAGVKKRKGVR